LFGRAKRRRLDKSAAPMGMFGERGSRDEKVTMGDRCDVRAVVPSEVACAGAAAL
jgi:hypothetical protein